jgi:hypothetical protein
VKGQPPRLPELAKPADRPLRSLPVLRDLCGEKLFQCLPLAFFTRA